MRRDLSKGDLPALILAVLSHAPRHGYAIAREVERLSDRALTLREGALYPALRVLEQDGLIAGKWEKSQSGKTDRRVYALTDQGAVEMAKRTADLNEYATLIQTMLGRIGHAQPA
jgi:PadR family transcriptional regulator, regulatory protein PadR